MLEGFLRRPSAPEKRTSVAEHFPKRMYHGTTSDFDDFSLEHPNEGSGRNTFRDAVWVTSNPEVASFYAMMPFLEGNNYLRTLIGKADLESHGLPAEKKVGTHIERFMKHALTDPRIRVAQEAFAAVLATHAKAKTDFFQRIIVEPKLRNEVLEAGERLADVFNEVYGTNAHIRPRVIPVRVNDRGFHTKLMNGAPMEYLGWEQLEGVRADASHKNEDAGITFVNVRDGAKPPSNVMAIFDLTRIRSELAGDTETAAS